MLQHEQVTVNSFVLNKEFVSLTLSVILKMTTFS